MDFSNHTFFCHSLGKIMVNPKTKSYQDQYNTTFELYKQGQERYSETENKETKTAIALFDKLNGYKNKLNKLEPILHIPNLSTTCKSELADIYTEITTGRTRDIKSKFMEKGLITEEEGITLYSRYIGKYYEKNKTRKYNKWIEGELDIVDDVFVIDNKSSWDIFSFNKNIPKKMESMHEWQLTGYMWLWNKKKARISFSLINTPKHLVERECTNLMYDMFGTKENFIEANEDTKQVYEEACLEIKFKHNFDDIPVEDRVIIQDMTLDESNPECIKKRVEDCRWYLNNFKTVKTIENEYSNNDGEEVDAE